MTRDHVKLLARLVIFGVIDIGSNTTRLLVAEPANGRLREVAQQRAFTRLGKGLRRDDAIPAKKVEEVAEVVATQVRVARELEADDLRVLATAVIRTAANRDELVEAVSERVGLEVHVLDEDEEARLAFVGATRMMTHPVEGDVAVADVGGGSCEIAVGTVDGGVRWTTSFRIGSGFLTDSYLHSDPPAIEELEAVRAHVSGTFEGLHVDRPAVAVAVGGSATSLRRLVGAELDHETLERGVRVLATTPVEEVARRFELEPERVRLLPAGILILEAVSDHLRRPLQIGRGGLREGAILERIAADE
jgi:exopolyphosphatase/guanosine-5'-triphosphate,3'-diphosphate pyrophosphatase